MEIEFLLGRVQERSGAAYILTSVFDFFESDFACRRVLDFLWEIVLCESFQFASTLQ